MNQRTNRSSTTLRLVKYSRGYPKPNAPLKWDVWTQSTLRLILDITTTLDNVNSSKSYRLRIVSVLSDAPSSSQAQIDQILEDLDISAYSALLHSSPKNGVESGLPFKVVYRENMIAFRYQYPIVQDRREGPTVYRRFQLEFSSSSDVAAFVKSIHTVCHCQPSASKTPDIPIKPFTKLMPPPTPISPQHHVPRAESYYPLSSKHKSNALRHATDVYSVPLYAADSQIAETSSRLSRIQDASESPHRHASVMSVAPHSLHTTTAAQYQDLTGDFSMRFSASSETPPKLAVLPRTLVPSTPQSDVDGIDAISRMSHVEDVSMRYSTPAADSMSRGLGACPPRLSFHNLREDVGIDNVGTAPAPRALAIEIMNWRPPLANNEEITAAPMPPTPTITSLRPGISPAVGLDSIYALSDSDLEQAVAELIREEGFIELIGRVQGLHKSRQLSGTL